MDCILRILALCVISFISTYSSCKKGLGCANESYVFETGIRAQPENDSIPVNDTVWFSINQNTRMTDLVTGSQVDFSNAANLSFVFGIRAVISPAEVLPAADSFNYVVRKGQHVTPLHPDYLREYRLAEENFYYKLEVGFVAKKKAFTECW